ncbi:Transferase family protein [Penicillium ucsense]|uniref:Transferase family protein n=1 Tax=Penicillium ucsense TaxID=2839758 RepID=A0A8J8W4I3_9EURO|nr:Transferase family protein [Penicillium ucsense]KAF7733921.1 Transferase family protein [Penicillium ucsense]
MTVPHDFESFELCPADYGFPMFYAGCSISFRVSNPEQGLVILRNAIARLVGHLPFLNGRVEPSARKVGVMEVRPPAQGDLKSDICIIQYLSHLRLPRKMDSLARDEVGEYDRNAELIMAPVHIAASPTDHPVMRFQINVLADGIVAALFVNHMVIDGTGIGILLESLAACCNGADSLACSIECEVNTRRNCLGAVGRDNPCDLPGPGEILSSPGVQSAIATGHEVVHDSSLLDYNFFIPNAKVEQLRQCIQSLSPGFVSQDDIVTAILWTCLGEFRSHRLSPEGQSASACMLQRVVNVRRRLWPQVSPRYLGNCFVMLNETMTIAELGDKAPLESEIDEEAFARQLAPIARLLRSRLDTVDDRLVRDYLSQFSTVDDWANTSVHEPDVAVTSIRRLSVYGESFGPVLGNVEDFEMLPYMNPEGVCTIKPRRGGDDDTWEVGVTLRREDMDRLRGNAKWRWLVNRESPLRIFEAIKCSVTT